MRTRHRNECVLCENVIDRKELYPSSLMSLKMFSEQPPSKPGPLGPEGTKGNQAGPKAGGSKARPRGLGAVQDLPCGGREAIVVHRLSPGHHRKYGK